MVRSFNKNPNYLSITQMSGLVRVTREIGWKATGYGKKGLLVNFEFGEMNGRDIVEVRI
jgi:hypothetical protein